MRLKTVWWVAASLVAAVALILAVVQFPPNGAGWPRVLLIAAIGASPLAIAAAARTVARERLRTPAVWLLLSAGTVLAVTGLLVIAADGALMLRLALNDWRILARATTATAPLGLIAVGAAWVGTAIGVARRERAWVRAATGVLALTALWFAASFAAASVWRVRAGTELLYDGGGLTIAAVIAVAGALALATPWVTGMTRARAAVGQATNAPAAGDGDPATRTGWAEPRRHPRARLVVASLAVVLLIGGAFAIWLDRGDRLVLAEVFPDPALAACVANAVGVNGAEARVSSADLADVRSLECPGPAAATAEPATSAITDLTGIGRLSELSSIDVTGNAVTDLAPLADLDLWGVVITDNPVSDLSPLAGMTKLTNLGASGTQVVDLGPLAGQTALAYLGLHGTGISDIGPLASVPNLNEVTLSDNVIADVGPLAGLQHLTSLDLARNAITHLGGLGDLPQLWTLDVSGNQISDLSDIPVFANLNELWLGENPLTGVEPLTALPALTGVDLTGAASDLPGIAELRTAGVYVGGLA